MTVVAQVVIVMLVAAVVPAVIVVVVDLEHKVLQLAVEAAAVDTEVHIQIAVEHTWVVAEAEEVLEYTAKVQAVQVHHHSLQLAEAVQAVAMAAVAV